MPQRDSSQPTQLTSNGISSAPENFDGLQDELKIGSKSKASYVSSDDESELTDLDMDTPSYTAEAAEIKPASDDDDEVNKLPQSDPGSDSESEIPSIQKEERPTLPEKLKLGAAHLPKTSYTRSISARNGRTRTSSDDEDLFPQKRSKPNKIKKYGNKNSFRAPSSSVLSSKTQENTEDSSQESEEKIPTGPVFKMPPPMPEVGSSFSLGISSKDTQPTTVFDGSSPLSRHVSMSPPPDFKTEKPESSRRALCPLCKAPVDLETLLIFEAQPKRRYREQAKFCSSHRKATVDKEWKAQGYPDINWDTFPERAQNHFKYLQGILNADTPSYYRNILDSTSKTGKALRLTLKGDGLENISCGYYGTKGTQKMLELVMERFSATLRRLAKNDRLITEATVVGYAQSVLVPELGVRLIKEDMGVDDDTARQIMKQSIALGERVNRAQDDIVHYEPEDEEEPED